MLLSLRYYFAERQLHASRYDYGDAADVSAKIRHQRDAMMP